MVPTLPVMDFLQLRESGFVGFEPAQQLNMGVAKLPDCVLKAAALPVTVTTRSEGDPEEQT